MYFQYNRVFLGVSYSLEHAYCIPNTFIHNRGCNSGCPVLYIVHVTHDNNYLVWRVQYIEHWTPGCNHWPLLIRVQIVVSALQRLLLSPFGCCITTLHHAASLFPAYIGTLLVRKVTWNVSFLKRMMDPSRQGYGSLPTKCPLFGCLSN